MCSKTCQLSLHQARADLHEGDDTLLTECLHRLNLNVPGVRIAYNGHRSRFPIGAMTSTACA